jgi:hypothetical protein
MRWAVALLALLESVDDHVKKAMQQDKKKDEVKNRGSEGGVLADARPAQAVEALDKVSLTKTFFRKTWASNINWSAQTLKDAVAFASKAEPRGKETIETVLHLVEPKAQTGQPKDNIAAGFAKAWKSLKNRGWKAEVLSSGDQAGKTRYEYEGKQVRRYFLSVQWACLI